MKIKLNGEPYELNQQLSVTDLLAQLDLEPRGVAVERNLIVLKRKSYDSTFIKEGDEIEVINFVGGGSLRILEKNSND